MRLFILAFVLGTFALQHAAALPELRLVPAGVAALLALRLLSPARRLSRGACLLIAGALIGAGAAAWRAEIRLADALPLAWEGEDIELEGLVAGLPQPTQRGTRFLFEVERILTTGAAVPETLALTWYPERARGRDAVVAPPRLAAGERWRLTVRLKRPRGLANPHGFDFEPWALERGIRATGYVRTKAAPRLVTARVDGWPYTLHRWRGEIREAMQAHLADARLAGVLVALAIGDQDAIASDDWEVFWRTGVGHLMSISGLHITMLAGLAFAIAFFAWVRVPALALRLPARKAAIVAGTLTALAYSLMTGYAVPAQRTFVMLATIAVCVLADRHGSPSRVLALAALAVIAIDPWAVLSAGFWLSFGAVAAIFYVMTLRTGRHGRLHGAVLEQLAVTVLMLPMLVALFQEFSLVSPIANAFAIPLVSLIVVPLTIAGAFLPLPALLDLAHAIMVATMSPLERLAALPMAMLESHEPAMWTVAAGVAGCAWLLAPRGFPLRTAGAVWAAPMFMVLPPSPAPGEAWVDVLDVGNGLAVIVRTARHALAYDAGPAWSADADSGNRIVVPFLRGEGITRLDGVVISHADDDHYGGAASVAYSREPTWLLSPLPADDVLHGAFERSIRCEAGQHWSWDGVDFLVLHPAAEIYAEERKRKENDRGCVVRVATRASSALLTGDVEARSEREMLARDPSALRAAVLVIPHHGSKTSSTPEFIDAVAPQIGVLSVGYRNRFRHPNAAVVERYVARSIELRRTDAEGALHVELPGREPGSQSAILERTKEGLMDTQMKRRRVLVWIGAVAAAPLAMTPALAEDRPPTPRMTEGPFYPNRLPRDSDADLTRVEGRAAAAEGKVLDVSGQVLDRSGKPRAGARVEIWQCDARGQYHHVGEPEDAGDPNFQGFGAVLTDADGRYAFRTIRPVPYPGRTPHIHFTVLEGGKRRLTSQMFIEGEPGNERDGLYRQLGRDAKLVTMRLESAGKGLKGALDIVLAS